MAILTKPERERLVQAVVYFASHVQALGKIKLFKLLYLFDFEHFRQTGRSATGLDYQAWKHGPVPPELMQEWDALNDDLAALVTIRFAKVIDLVRQNVELKDGVRFDSEPFSPRQLRILEQLADEHRNDLSGRMIDVTHDAAGPWSRVYGDGVGAFRPIPYEMSLDGEGAQAAALREVAREQAMYRAAVKFGRSPDPF